MWSQSEDTEFKGPGRRLAWCISGMPGLNDWIIDTMSGSVERMRPQPPNASSLDDLTGLRNGVLAECNHCSRKADF